MSRAMCAAGPRGRSPPAGMAPTVVLVFTMIPLRGEFCAVGGELFHQVPNLIIGLTRNASGQNRIGFDGQPPDRPWPQWKRRSPKPVSNTIVQCGAALAR